MSELSDKTLVMAALHEPNAYGLLIKCYESKLRRYVGRIMFNQNAAIDDVLQNTFIKAYINLKDYDQTRPLGSWLYRIAHNEAINYLRKTRSGPATISGEDAEIFMAQCADPNDPHSLLCQGHDAGLVQQALSTLEQKYRDVLVLRFLEDHSYSAISDILHLPPGTVATLIKRGLQKMRVAFETAEGEP